MQLHELKGKKKGTIQRVGRGGKRGTTAGRGTKGQRSRSGHKIRPAMRDLIIRLPKRRGFRNKPTTDKAYTIDVVRLASLLKTKAEKGKVRVNRMVLRELSIIPMRFLGPLKVLGGGEITIAMELHGVKASDTAKAAIEKAGGKVF